MSTNKSFHGSNCKFIGNVMIYLEKQLDFFVENNLFLADIDSVRHRQIPHKFDSLPSVVISDEITLKRQLNLWSGICVIVGITIGK